ncbi:MAG: WbqC family protein [Bacteroidales bacterium]|nr:WbqC family protein [Bacteroidales bacterium]MCF8458494.1 WbqC family protein [Bacteroidales bacterium]
MLLLNTAYFPPIQYFSKIARTEKVVLEAHENYLKQSYRNRCYIYGANGKLSLNIPIKKASGLKMPIRDVKIEYLTHWQKIHWKSIESAYQSSPFFEFYIDDLIPFFQNKHKFLFDFNLEIIQFLIEALELDSEITLSETYEKPGSFSGQDYRDIIHPKKDFNKFDPKFNPQEYTQVFSPKHGFIPNLSVLDLLLNTGPEAGMFL